MNHQKIKILVTGAGGQLGKTFQAVSKKNIQKKFFFFDSQSLDITRLDHLRNKMDDVLPDVVINCAAYTAVDKAEAEPEKSFDINVKGIENLCKSLPDNALLIHYSSDYVYHSITGRPIKETDPTTPKGTYARHKLEGEKTILKSGKNACILRTSWVYSEYGSNFVKTMLRLSENRSELAVVDDQIGAPTYAGDLVSTTLTIVDRYFLNRRKNIKGKIYNYAGGGQTSWYEFAKKIFEWSNKKINLIPVSTEDFDSPAPRPSWSVMDMQKIHAHYGIRSVHWENRLREVIHKIT